MQKIVKQIEVVAYNCNWPIVFEAEANLIKTAFGGNCVAVHHVGSTSVNGLSAKPIIDIIAEVKNGTLSINQLEKIGFVYKGEWNIPFKYGFTKRGQTSINLHVYEENHPTITDANHCHFILCKGTKVVCVAHIEFFNTKEIALRSLATDEIFQNQGFGTHMLQLLEKWLKVQNAKLIKVHANLKAEKFYRQNGYQDMHFDDQSISTNVIDLGKLLL
jgi:hypothetical protein